MAGYSRVRCSLARCQLSKGVVTNVITLGDLLMHSLGSHCVTAFSKVSKERSLKKKKKERGDPPPQDEVVEHL